MKMTSLTSNPCLVHPPVQGFFRSRAEFRGSTGSETATTQGTHGGSIRERGVETQLRRGRFQLQGVLQDKKMNFFFTFTFAPLN